MGIQHRAVLQEERFHWRPNQPLHVLDTAGGRLYRSGGGRDHIGRAGEGAWSVHAYMGAHRQPGMCVSVGGCVLKIKYVYNT